MNTFDVEQHEEIYTISRLNNEVRFLLEDTFPFIWVEGEISNFAAPHSGHWYFCLKDAAAQVRCAMFKSSQQKIKFSAKDGMHVLARARVSLYPNRGDYQLIVEHLEERGVGKLQRAFEALKKKLAAAGLFAPEHKKPLPLFPSCIGVITSPTGAAIRDILTVLKRRLAAIPVIIYPTLVQGATAAPNIVATIQKANARKECDVLILARGGGSLEDLWAFNEEMVAQAIFTSELPIISGIGHEVDFTIADFVADQRAPTPSAAAEIITPDKAELLQTLARQKQLIFRQMQQKLGAYKQQLTWLERHLAQQHPKRRLLEKMQRLDFCEVSLAQLQNRLINQLQNKLTHLRIRLAHLSPTERIRALQHQLLLVSQQLNKLILLHLNKQQASFANAAAKLDALSPLATLQRGFAIATKNQQLLYAPDQVNLGDKIQVRLARGALSCEVKEKLD